MCAYDNELSAVLDELVGEGMVDIKCHIDVSSASRPDDVKRAMLNALTQDKAGTVPTYKLSEIESFAFLLARIH